MGMNRFQPQDKRSLSNVHEKSKACSVMALAKAGREGLAEAANPGATFWNVGFLSLLPEKAKLFQSTLWSLQVPAAGLAGILVWIFFLSWQSSLTSGNQVGKCFIPKPSLGHERYSWDPGLASPNPGFLNLMWPWMVFSLDRYSCSSWQPQDSIVITDYTAISFPSGQGALAQGGLPSIFSLSTQRIQGTWRSVSAWLANGLADGLIDWMSKRWEEMLSAGRRVSLCHGGKASTGKVYHKLLSASLVHVPLKLK